MQYYQKTHSFCIIHRVGIERQTMGTVDGTCAGQVGIHFAPCFVHCSPNLSGLYTQVQLSWKFLWVLFKGVNIQKTTALMNHVYYFLTDTVSSYVTALMPLYFPQVKWEMSFIIKVLKSISMRIAEAVKSPNFAGTS